MTAKLELKDISKSFGDVAAVKGTSIVLEKGEFLSLLGPSGCGKSTTLSMIAGFLRPDAGEIVVDGKVINRVPPQHRRIGLVFQDYAIFSKLTVRANLAFGLEARRMPRAERERLIDEYAKLFSLTDILKQRGSALNMSEMQRVALARVLITKPQLLLLDEPMSNLDAAQRAGLRGEMKQLQKELQQTILYVTHDQIEAMSMSDRIAVMPEGAICQVGSPEEIYHRPCNRFVAEFIGDPPINILPCILRRSGESLSATTAEHENLALGRGALDPGEHLLGVRPHDFKAVREPVNGAAAAIVRFVENFGAEHVLHVEYGTDLARVVVPPGFASVGETIHLSLDPRRVHLIDRADGRVVPLEGREAAA